jgi:hypothetical protein
MKISEFEKQLASFRKENGDLSLVFGCARHISFEQWRLRVIKDHNKKPRVAFVEETATFEGLRGLPEQP